MLLALALEFAALSLISVGGANTVLPEMHRRSVDARGWVSDAQFSELFALAQAAPGPNVLVVCLIGWMAAGLAGALVAIIAVCLPTCLLAFFASRAIAARRGARWTVLLQEGMAPITVGLILASGWLISAGAARGPLSIGIIVFTALATLLVPLHPLWWIAGGAGLGLLGWV